MRRRQVLSIFCVLLALAFIVMWGMQSWVWRAAAVIDLVGLVTLGSMLQAAGREVPGPRETWKERYP